MSIATSHAQALAPGIPTPSQVQLTPSDMSDTLIELGRANHTNFIADATHFPKDITAVDKKQTVTFERHLEALSSKHTLTWLPKEKVLLVWSAPDLSLLAKMAIEGDTIHLIVPPAPAKVETAVPANVAQRLPTKPTSTLNMPSAQELLFQEVASYMREKHGWDDATPDSLKEVGISDLPPPLRAKVAAAVQASLLRPEALTIWSAWFSDEFWNNAELKLVEETNGNPNGPKIPVLTVGGVIQTKTIRGGSMISLGALKGLPKN